MRRAKLISGFAATSLLIALPTTSLAQGSPDLDKGSGVGHSASPTGRAEARQQERITPRSWSNEPQEKPWFLEDSVRAELGIQEREVGPLYDNYALVWQRYKENQAKLEAGRTAEEQAAEEQAELAKDLRANYNRDMEEYASRYMNDTQRQRYQQLNTQYQGINAFSDPGYVEYFGFDDRQLGYIDRLQGNYNARMDELSRFTGDPEERRRAFNDLRQQTQADLDRILTDRQRQQLQEMQGNPFEFNDNDFLRSAEDIDTGAQQAANPTGPNTGTPGSPNPGSGVGLPQGAGQGSGVGLPQPTAPGSGTSGPPNNGPGGTSGDLDDNTNPNMNNNNNNGSAAPGNNNTGNRRGNSNTGTQPRNPNPRAGAPRDPSTVPVPFPGNSPGNGGGVAPAGGGTGGAGTGGAGGGAGGSGGAGGAGGGGGSGS
ncbi:hypothetical protein [Aeoliella sp. SH292]|uniref:hypothetical protein n=1 Tax=Aeoliella sp. SH292 TaxID=3454464 RepID=UPI003F966585